ncbi:MULTISPECIES: AlpA family transcriptional regulator [unclassified Acinetobacter]|uniref:helix-turn-helix transcriptional regulator n=1 Tax=unclassified Acinetobacter TaxID=196816 RepID=UPI0015D44684|nr:MULTISPECIES: AlpA family phage regulatory protein [unclassified Acinetobacter]MBI1452992.1 AlpA family phage regulatory protein [Acinetobacter sp. FL51]
MEIDRRVRAKEFMDLMSIGREKFYSLINSGDIQQPIRVTDRDVFWYASYVKNKVEEYKPQT